MFLQKSIAGRVCTWAVIMFSVSASALMVQGGPRGAEVKDPASVIRITPPAPAFDEKAWHAELGARRARVAQALGSKALLVLFSTEPRVYAHDVNYEYRQENNLFYLTNLNQKRATLVLVSGANGAESILFLPRRS